MDARSYTNNELNRLAEALQKNGPSFEVCKSFDQFILNEDVQDALDQNPSLKERCEKLGEQIVHELALNRILKSRALFLNIPEDELSRIDSEKKDERNTPEYDHTVEDVNDTTRYIQWDILARKTLAESILAVKRWANVLHQCLEEDDFQSVFIIIGAFDSEPFKRFFKKQKPFFEEKGERTLQYIDTAEELTSPLEKYKEYRASINQAIKNSVALIPYLGPLKQALILEKELGNEEKIDEIIQIITKLQVNNKKLTRHKEKIEAIQSASNNIHQIEIDKLNKVINSMDKQLLINIIDGILMGKGRFSKPIYLDPVIDRPPLETFRNTVDQAIKERSPFSIEDEPLIVNEILLLGLSESKIFKIEHPHPQNIEDATAVTKIKDMPETKRRTLSRAPTYKQIPGVFKQGQGPSSSVDSGEGKFPKPKKPQTKT